MKKFSSVVKAAKDLLKLKKNPTVKQLTKQFNKDYKKDGKFIVTRTEFLNHPSVKNLIDTEKKALAKNFANKLPETREIKQLGGGTKLVKSVTKSAPTGTGKIIGDALKSGAKTPRQIQDYAKKVKGSELTRDQISKYIEKASKPSQRDPSKPSGDPKRIAVAKKMIAQNVGAKNKPKADEGKTSTKVSKKVSEGYTGKKETMSKAEFNRLPKGIQNKIKNDVILKKAGGLVKRKYGGQIGTKSNSFSGSDFVASGYTKIG
jgi:hypothetical protein